MSSETIRYLIVIVGLAGFIYYRFIDNFFATVVGNYVIFPAFIIIEIILLVLYFKKKKKGWQKLI